MTTPAQPTTDEDVESLQEIIRSGWLHKMVFTTQYVAALEALARLVARIVALEAENKRLRKCSTCGHEEYFKCGECQAHVVFPTPTEEPTE